MQHSFDVMIAQKYGVQPAIILNHLYWWVEKNKANKVHFYDGYYWTYNSKSAFAEIFPYMNARQIDYALKKLIDNGLVITGNYNKSAYDRTLWYAITKMGYSILQNCKMEETKLQNGNNKNVKPIPNINNQIENKNINNNNKYKNNSVCNINNSFKNIGKDTHALLQPIFEVLPDIIIDTETIPSNFNSQLVAEAISKSSKFLSNVKAVSFLIDHYNDIVKGKYDDYGKATDKDKGKSILSYYDLNIVEL